MTQLIAEFCQNHNGNMDLLARMVEAAAKAGAVKPAEKATDAPAAE